MSTTIGEHVRKRRTDLGFTQTEAAAQIGIVRDALARWEVNHTGPDVRVMPKVIEFLGYDPTPEAQGFPERLRRARRSLGLSQAEFADRIGVPMNTLHDWERGRCEPKPTRKATVERRLSIVTAHRDAIPRVEDGS